MFIVVGTVALFMLITFYLLARELAYVQERINADCMRERIKPPRTNAVTNDDRIIRAAAEPDRLLARAGALALAFFPREKTDAMKMFSLLITARRVPAHACR